MKKIKIVAVILLIILNIIVMMKPIYATNTVTERHTAGEIINEAKGFIEKGQDGSENRISSDNLKTMSNTIYNILLVTGIILAIIVGIIMGIKFIMGGVEEKAEIKAMLLPYVIGCIVVFGAFTIWKIFVDILQSM